MMLVSFVMRYEQSWLIYRPSCLPGFGATGSPHAEILTTELMIGGTDLHKRGSDDSDVVVGRRCQVQLSGVRKSIEKAHVPAQSAVEIGP